MLVPQREPLDRNAPEMRPFLNIDIETIPAQDPAVRDAIYNAPDLQVADVISEIKPSGSLKDPDKIAADIAARTEKAWAALAEDKAKALAKAEQRYLKTALDGAFGHVVSIAYSVDRVNDDGFMEAGEPYGKLAASVEDERVTLDFVFREMEEDIADGERPVIVGHHIAGFDLLFLTQRAIILGVRLPAWWPRNPRPWAEDVFDTMHQWSPARDSWVSLDTLCKALGLRGKGDIDGSKVYELWKAGEYQKIWDYNADDVRKVSEIHRRFKAAFGEVFDQDAEAILSADRNRAFLASQNAIRAADGDAIDAEFKRLLAAGPKLRSSEAA